MKKYGLYKKEKLCSATAIDALFGPGGASFARLCYPLRAVARQNPGRRSDSPVMFLISVPKKRLRHAVDRVKMRRRIREAYRLNHGEFPLPADVKADVAFVYVADRLTDYAAVCSAMRRLLAALSQSFSPSEPQQADEIPS